MAAPITPPSTHWTKSLTLYSTFAILTSTLGPLQFGYHIAELNAPQDALSCHTTIPSSPPSLSTTLNPTAGLPPCIPMGAFALGLVTSTFTIGGLIGALSAGPLSTSQGRAPAMRLSAACFVLGSILEATAMNISAMAAGRFLSGLGAGAALVVVPIFVAEVSPEEGRGRLGAATQIGIGLGVLGAVLMGYFFSEGGGVWRVILAVGVLLGGVYGLGLMGVDESPRWLVGKGRTEDARRALGRLRRGGDVDGEIKGWAGRHDEEDTEEGADDTVEEQEGLLSADAPKAGPNSNNTHHLHHQHVGILEMLSLQRTRPALIAILVAQSAQQLTGINSVIMYSVALLSDLLPSAAALLTVLVALTNLLGTLAFAPLIDSLGRKSCLLLSVATMGSSALALALAMTVGIPVLAGVATLTFVMGFSMGLGPVPFMLAAELVGPGAVGSLQSWGLGANWVATFLVAQLLPPLSLAVGKGGVYFLFTVLGVVYFGLVWVFVPETKGCRDSEAVWARFRDGRKKKGLGTDGGD